MQNEDYIFGFNENYIIEIAILYKNYNIDYRNLHIHNTYITNEIALDFLKYKKFGKVSKKLKDWSIGYVDDMLDQFKNKKN